MARSFLRNTTRRALRSYWSATYFPHNLLQGELTSSEFHGWGLLTNGYSVRILRKTNRPSIQESLEFDLEKMFTDRLYPDFCLFAMIVHGTRWSFDKENPMDCWLERWYKSSKEERAFCS